MSLPVNTKTTKYISDVASEFSHVTESYLNTFTTTGYKGMKILDFDKLAQSAIGGKPYEHGYYLTGTPGYRLFDHLSYNLGVAYYARPRESFDNLQGQKDALESGATYIILEDMS